jgi:hypothetical protein
LKPGGGEIFRTRPDRPYGPPSLLYSGDWVFPGGRTAGAWCRPPTLPSAEVENELYMFRVLFAPILRNTTAAYRHRCVYGFGMLVCLLLYAAVVLLRMGANITRNM